MGKNCAKFVPRMLRQDQKERHCQDRREMVELINSDPAVFDALVTCNENWIYCWPRDPETKRQRSQRKHAGYSRPKKARQSKSTHKLLMIPFFFLTALAWSTSTGFPLERQSTGNTMLWFWGSSGRDSVARGQHFSNRVSGISTRAIHQSTTPYLSQTIWQRWASRQFFTLFTVQILLPVTFAYSLSSEAVVMRELRRWKGLWQRSLTHSHKRTSMGHSRICWNGTTRALQLEEITSKGTRVSCAYYQ